MCRYPIAQLDAQICVNFVSHFICFLLLQHYFHSILISFIFTFFVLLENQAAHVDVRIWFCFSFGCSSSSCLQFFTDKVNWKTHEKKNFSSTFPTCRGRFTGKESYGIPWVFDCFFFITFFVLVCSYSLVFPLCFSLSLLES